MKQRESEKMDTSQQTAIDDSAGNSMYLSFDATLGNNSSLLSNDAYKTTVGDKDDTFDDSKELHMNSTLEADHLEKLGGIHSKLVVKRADTPIKSAKKSSLRKQLMKNKAAALQEYKAMSSTPTKEELIMRNVDMERGSKENDLSLFEFDHINDVDVSKKINQLQFILEDKENECPENQDTLIASKDVCLSVKKDDNTQVEKKKEIVVNIQKMLNCDGAEGSTESFLSNSDRTEMSLMAPKEASPAKVTKLPPIAEKSGQGHAVLHIANNNKRQSMCEPNLKTNRPSRIGSKMTSFAAALDNKTSHELKELATEIPKLIKKISKISMEVNDATGSDMSNGDSSSGGGDKSHQTSTNGRPETSNNKPKIPVTKRRTLFLNTQAEKRPYNVAQRMSVVVKTTLNSPAHKLARRSIAVGSSSSNFSGKGMMPMAKDSRRTMLPVGRVASTKTFSDNKNENSSTVKTDNPSLKTNSEITTSRKKNVFHKPKMPISRKFICTICNTEFSIKSLLDAHKRTHEDVKPTTTTTAATTTTGGILKRSVSSCSTANGNQCKYCDRKFALVRTLHIHMMQNCTKIPPTEKRNLNFTEMDHVEKPQLPTFVNQNNNNNNNVVKKSPKKIKKVRRNSADSSAEKKEIAAITRELMAAIDDTELLTIGGLSPPAKPRVKKTMPHSGVFPTPNKKVPCHACKLSFKSVLDYTNHCMIMHVKQPIYTDNPAIEMSSGNSSSDMMID